MIAVVHPLWFIAGGVLWIALAIAAWSWARDAALADAVKLDLSASAGASPPSREPGFLSSSSGRSGSGRGGQRVSLAVAQERAARDALRCMGGRVDVAPVRCPVRERAR